MVQRIPRTIALGALLTLLPGSARPQSSPFLLRDTQLWSEVLAFHSLRQDTDLMLIGDFRLGRNASHPVYERAGAGPSFKLGTYVTLTPLYSYFAMQPLEGQDNREHRISLEATAAIPLGRWTVTSRNRIERRFRDPADSTRYKTLLQLERSMRLGNTPFRVFAWDEVLYDWSFNAWVRNRFSVGGGKNLNNKCSVDIFYVRQNASHAVPRDLHAIGVLVKTRF